MSSTASNDSLPSTTSSGFSLSPHEMSLIVLDNPSVDLLNETFGGDCTASAHLRHYMFVSQSIRRLESELDRHHAEQRTLFDHILENENFRRDLHPIITTYRRQSRAKGFHPYTQLPLTPPPRSPRLPSSPKSSPASPTRKPRSRKAYSSSDSFPMTKEENDIITTYLANHGTPLDPIVIEESDKELLPACQRCKQQGHDASNCDTHMKTFLFCEVCKWKRTPQCDCPHIDMSPVAFRKLRGNIPYDNSD